MNYTEGLVEQFKFVILLTVVTVLVPLLFTAASYGLVIIDKKLQTKNKLQTIGLSGLGFAYSLWAIYGAGHDIVFYGFLLLLSGIPFYILIQWNKREK